MSMLLITSVVLDPFSPYPIVPSMLDNQEGDTLPSVAYLGNRLNEEGTIDPAFYIEELSE